jgi:DNA-binding response OmpR family regulator
MYKVLVVEDEKRLGLAIAAYLASQGVHPIVMTTAQEAVNTLAEGEVDLVVLDLELTDGDGLDMLRHIRGSLDLVDLPVLAVASWDTDPTFCDYLEPGNYLIKPFDVRTLDWMMQQLLGFSQNRCLGMSLKFIIHQG